MKLMKGRVRRWRCKSSSEWPGKFVLKTQGVFVSKILISHADSICTYFSTVVGGWIVPPCGMSLRTFCTSAQCPSGHSALVRNVPPDIPH